MAYMRLRCAKALLLNLCLICNQFLLGADGQLTVAKICLSSSKMDEMRGQHVF